MLFRLKKSKHNSWIAKVWIAEELFYYAHPFLLPTFFKQKATKYEFYLMVTGFCFINILNIEYLTFLLIN